MFVILRLAPPSGFVCADQNQSRSVQSRPPILRIRTPIKLMKNYHVQNMIIRFSVFFYHTKIKFWEFFIKGGYAQECVVYVRGILNRLYSTAI